MEMMFNTKQEISYILFTLLNGNFDCVKYCINKLKQIEHNEARNYHIERFKLNKSPLFGTHSFLHIINGFKFRKSQQKKIDNANKIYGGEKSPPLNKIQLSHQNIIQKYNELLEYPNLTEDFRKNIEKMKKNRIQMALQRLKKREI